MKDRWIGVDVGGTKCAVTLAYIDGGIHILDKESFATRVDLGFEQAYDNLCRAIEVILARNGADISRVISIGVSCGGPLDSKSGVILCPPNLPGWENVPLAGMLREKYGVDVFIQNDANACALVEWKMGAGRDSENMIFLTMGTGMGAGIIAEGKLLRGHADMAGEVGHMRLSEKGPAGYGKEGSFEGHASGGGMGRQAVELTRKLIDEGNPPQWILDGHSIDEADAKLLADYARGGDEQAAAFYDDIGRMLGRGLALLVDAFNPEIIVIGGVFMRCEDLLRPAMECELKKEAVSFSLAGTRVVAAETGEAIGDLASVMAAMYAMGIDPMAGAAYSGAVLRHYNRLFERYAQLEGCRDDIMAAYDILEKCFRGGNKLMLVGNGGSCADCEHIAGELMKGFYLKRPLKGDLKEAIRRETERIASGAADKMQQGLPAIALTGHAALTTAVQNDVDPYFAPAQQLLSLANPGDVVIGISTSGGAKNVLIAIGVAKALGLKTIALTGEGGGELKRACDCAIAVPGTSPADVQELHLPVYHALCAMIEARFFES